MHVSLSWNCVCVTYWPESIGRNRSRPLFLEVCVFDLKRDFCGWNEKIDSCMNEILVAWRLLFSFAFHTEVRLCRHGDQVQARRLEGMSKRTQNLETGIDPWHFECTDEWKKYNLKAAIFKNCWSKFFLSFFCLFEQQPEMKENRNTAHSVSNATERRQDLNLNSFHLMRLVCNHFDLLITGSVFN